MWPFESSSSAAGDMDPEILAVFVRLHSGEVTAADQAYFERWRRENPELLADYDELDGLWNELGLYSADLGADQLERYLADGAIVKPRGFAGRKAGALAIAATVVLALGVAFSLQWFPVEDSIRYQTGRGERMVINLDDGSIVHLNSLSVVEIRFNAQRREIELARGEALFNVAKDPWRKFVVRTGRGVVEALGTQFNVNLAPDQLAVTVLEGVVAVKPLERADEGVRPEIATVGQRVVVDESGEIKNDRPPDPSTIVAWSRGKLIFSGEPLSEAVERVNRHSKHNISVKDPRLRDLPIYGVFNTGDARGFVNALQEAYPLRAVDLSGNTTVLLHRDKTGA